LIRRFIDPQAELLFVDPTADIASPDGHTFDTRGAEHGHEGGKCTFPVDAKIFGQQRMGTQLYFAKI
jgi:hypothetical protein